ncbi:hypothetical protein F4805DRAFT_150152 [Annulohypoxylon moriforme]|nr:hypothetical protein F4805DRAFT_150152 [Annulohypoxylon moriforme]
MDCLPVTRVNLLVCQFRDKIKQMATLQRRIHCDMQVIIADEDGVRNKFEETREGYLNLLDLSVSELREMMSASDLIIPTNDFEVEDIMGRVKPVTERYLQRLVNFGYLTENDMECILVGKYKSIEEYFYDVNNNPGVFGLKEDADLSLDDLKMEPDADQAGGYDEDGFFVLDEGGSTKDASETDDSTMEQPEASPLTPPVVLLPPSESFSWADDVEDELETSEPPKTLDRECLVVTPSPIEEERSPVDASFPSDSSETHSDVSSDFDFDISQPELINSSMSEIPTIDHDPEKENDSQCAVADSDSEMLDADRADEVEVPIAAVFPTYRSLCEQTDGDEILDEWLEEQEMWYWQYEALFLMTLAAKSYKAQFEEARSAYKADPFNDD